MLWRIGLRVRVIIPLLTVFVKSDWKNPDYISSRRLLLSLADAGGRLMYAYKDVLELAGLTTRLYTLLSTLHHLPPLPTSHPDSNATEPTITLSHVDVTIPTSSTTALTTDDDSEQELAPEMPPLVRDLNLTLGSGNHLMITGSNGVGKTAVARVLAGLWAPGGGKGEVMRPQRGEVFVVPQRAYMVAGSLLDQCVCAASSFSIHLRSLLTRADWVVVGVGSSTPIHTRSTCRVEGRRRS